MILKSSSVYKKQATKQSNKQYYKMFSKEQRFNLMEMIAERKKVINECKIELAVLITILDTKNVETMTLDVREELREIFPIIMRKYSIEKEEKGININVLEGLKKDLSRKKKYTARHVKFFIYCYNGNRKEAQKYHDLLTQDEQKQIEDISGLEEDLSIIIDTHENERINYGNKEEGYRTFCNSIMETYQQREKILKCM